MKRSDIVKLGLVTPAIAGAYAVGVWNGKGSPPAPPPKAGLVGFDPAEVDLGRLPWFSEAPFTLTFVNGSPSPVTVAAVTASCGCLGLDSSRYAGSIVPAGGKLEFPGKLEAGERLGERSEEVHVMVDSAAMRTTIRTGLVKYEAFSTYRWSPAALEFPAVNLDDDGEDIVVSALFSSGTARIVGQPDADSPWLEVGLHDRGNGETHIAAHLLKRNLAHGSNSGRILVKTDDPFKPSFTIPVSAQGTSWLLPIPSHLFLRVGEQRMVRFVVKDGQWAAISSVSTDVDAVEASVQPDGLGVAVQLRQPLENASLVSVTDRSGQRTRFLVSWVK